MIRLSNGMNVDQRALASAAISLTKDPEYGVFLVRNVDRRAIKVQLFLMDDGRANKSIAISYRLASIAAAMAAKQHWKRIRVVEDDTGDTTVFRFCHVSHPYDSAFEPPVLCTIDQLLTDHIKLTKLGIRAMIGQWAIPGEERLQAMIDPEHVIDPMRAWNAIYEPTPHRGIMFKKH